MKDYMDHLEQIGFHFVRAEAADNQICYTFERKDSKETVSFSFLKNGCEVHSAARTDFRRR